MYATVVPSLSHQVRLLNPSSFLLHVASKIATYLRAMSQETSLLTNWIIGAATACILAILGWVGVELVTTRDIVYSLNGQLPDLHDDVASVFVSVKANMEEMKLAMEKNNVDVKDAIKQLVTRPELESRLAEIKVDAGSIKVEQSRINLELYKLQEAAKNRDETAALKQKNR